VSGGLPQRLRNLLYPDRDIGKSTMAKTSSTNQLLFDNRHYDLNEITVELVREKAEQIVLDLIARKLFHY
jgi:hypothetical protein